MTVPSAINKSGPYIGNGVTDVFDYDFRIVDETHVRVILTDTVGAETTLVLNSDYTVSGVGAPGGGQVTLSTAPATGELLTLIRNVPFVQETDLENQGPYFAETVEDALDLAAMRDQQLQEQVSRAVKIPASADPDELDQLIEDVIRLQGSADNIDTVAGSIANVNTVGNNIADVNTVAGNIGNVGVVAGISGNVTIVAQNIGDVNTVAGDTAEINALAPISADISAVSGVAASVPTVAGIASDVEIVADNVADVTNFASVYLGARATDPTTRTDGSPLQVGDLYFDTTGKVMNVWEGVSWVPAATSSLGGLLTGFGTFGVSPDGEVPVGGFTTLFVWVNGVLLREGEDYTQDGTSFTVTNPVEGDEWQYWAYQANDATDYYTKTEADAEFYPRTDVDGLLDAKLNKDGSNATARTKWRLRAIGEIVHVDTSLTGVEIPPDDAGFIELSAGLDGSGGYNEGKLTSETITGSGATLVATAVIDDASSPLDGQTINLINTEERVRYAGERAKAGGVFNDQMQTITGAMGTSTIRREGVVTEGAFVSSEVSGNVAQPSGSTNGTRFNFDSSGSPGARTGDRTRAKGQFLVAFLKYKDVA